MNKHQRKLLEKLVENDKISLRFNKSEIQQLCSVFNQACREHDTDWMSLPMFQCVFGINDVGLAKTTFRLFDVNNTGYIALHEFLVGYSQWKSRLDSEDERQLLAFNLFDADDDGRLGKEEFKNMVRSCQEIDNFQVPEMTLLAAKELAEVLFRDCGVDPSNPNAKIEER